VDLERQIRQNAVLPSLKRALARARMTLRGFLRVYPQMFRVARGTVSVVNAPPAADDPPAAAPAAPAAPPRPETREERNARLDRLLAESREREDAARARAQAAREERTRERFGGLRGAFGERPR